MNQTSQNLALARAADAMLRALGATEITLVLPVRAESGPPQSEEVPLSPVLIRRIAGKFELLMPAAALESVMHPRGHESADAFFEAVVGARHDGRLLYIASVGADTFAGATYLYRVTAVEQP